MAWAPRTIAWRCTIHGGDKLFLPVENIELLSRYGSDEDACSWTGWAAPPGSRARPG